MSAIRELLLGHQSPLFESLARRGWRTVVNETITVLDRISTSGVP